MTFSDFQLGVAAYICCQHYWIE